MFMLNETKLMVYRVIGASLGLWFVCVAHQFNLTEQLLIFLSLLLVFSACVARQTLGRHDAAGDIHTIFDASIVFSCISMSAWILVSQAQPSKNVLAVISICACVVIVGAVIFEGGRRYKESEVNAVVAPMTNIKTVDSSLHETYYPTSKMISGAGQRHRAKQTLPCTKPSDRSRQRTSDHERVKNVTNTTFVKPLHSKPKTLRKTPRLETPESDLDTFL